MNYATETTRAAIAFADAWRSRLMGETTEDTLSWSTIWRSAELQLAEEEMQELYKLVAASLPYTVSPARYSKGNHLVRVAHVDSYKTRAERLLCALRCRYTHREQGYVASPSKLKKFRQLYNEGWDSSSFTLALIPPEEPKNEN